MKLSLSKRTGETKSEKSLIRHKGNIPAVIYSKGKDNHLVTIDGIDILPWYRNMATEGVLQSDQPFYCWYHTVSGQGWLLRPQVSSKNAEH